MSKITLYAFHRESGTGIYCMIDTEQFDLVSYLRDPYEYLINISIDQQTKLLTIGELHELLNVPDTESCPPNETPIPLSMCE